MSQTVLYQNNNLSNEQLHLLKYCYANMTSVQEETRVLIQLCNRPQLISKLDYILECYIMPYFFIERTLFDRLRNSFVEFMRLCLSETSIDGLSPYSFLCNYRSICAKLGIIENAKTNPIYEKLYKRIESQLPELI